MIDEIRFETQFGKSGKNEILKYHSIVFDVNFDRLFFLKLMIGIGILC